MKRSLVALAALLATLAVIWTVAVVDVVSDDDGWDHPMMMARGETGPGWDDGRGPGNGPGWGKGWGNGRRHGWGQGWGHGWGDGWGNGRGAMMLMMRGHQVRSEAEYLAEMVAHHEEAIAAAEELARSDRPAMRALGASVVRSQTAQVAQMERWLEQWYADEVPDVDYEPMMRDLTGLSGDRLDRAFLEDMVPHHMTAVMMSQQLLVRGLAEHDEVADLADDIRDEQRREIFQMRRWYADWFRS